jgi:hypothetical protein
MIGACLWASVPPKRKVIRTLNDVYGTPYSFTSNLSVYVSVQETKPSMVHTSHYESKTDRNKTRVHSIPKDP